MNRDTKRDKQVLNAQRLAAHYTTSQKGQVGSLPILGMGVLVDCNAIEIRGTDREMQSIYLTIYVRRHEENRKT